MTNRSLILLLVAAWTAFASPAKKVASDLPEDAGSGQDVIVQFTSAPTAAAIANIGSKGPKLKSAPTGVKLAAFTVHGKEAQDIASRADVSYVSPDRPVAGKLDYTAAAVNATIAWKYGWTGKGIGIAVIDSGVSTDKDFKQNGKGEPRVVYEESFGGLKDTADSYGHGTHVAGIVAGDGTESQGRLRGIAPGASVINLRVLDSSGAGRDSDVIAAIARAIQLKDQYHIRVINLSLGRPVFESYQLDPLCQAVEAAWKAGIVVVVAAGNNGRDNSLGNQGYATINAPGNDPYVITVGAMKTGDTLARGDDLVASYSSKGPTALDHIVKPDLVAPGNRVVSTMGNGAHSLETAYPQNASTGNYFRLSGTSMATPVVAGAAALLLEQNPSLTPDQVKARLMKTAAKTFPTSSIVTDPDTGITYRSVYDIFTIGAGYLDINAALNNSDLAAKPALSPAAVYNPTTRSVRLVLDNSVVWGGSVVWGDSVVWGSSVVWGDSVVWGSTVVWGDRTTAGFSVIWGDSVVWGSGAGVTGEHIAISGEK